MQWNIAEQKVLLQNCQALPFCYKLFNLLPLSPLCPLSFRTCTKRLWSPFLSWAQNSLTLESVTALVEWVEIIQ